MNREILQTQVSRRDVLRGAGLGLSLALGGGILRTSAQEGPREVKDETGSHVKGFFDAAPQADGSWTLNTPDNEALSIKLPDSFTPDASLNLPTGDADIDVKVKKLGGVPAEAGDFQTYLNTSDNPAGEPLAGYSYGTNDYNQYGDHAATPQLPALSWEVFTGLDVSVPGIGRVKGGEGRAAMVLILNRTKDVFRWPDEQPVEVEAGFQGVGRLWNGDADVMDEAEERLVNHYRFNLGNANPESGLIGQCDQGADNCDSVSVVTAERVQWGVDEDNNPRYMFRLLRAEDVSVK